MPDEQQNESDQALVLKARHLEWRQGDRLRYAILTETERGSAKRAAALATRREPTELTMLVRVCEAFADTRRRYDLTFEHHEAVLKLAGDDARDEMLAEAAVNGWTPRQTRQAVLAKRVMAGDYHPPEDDDPEDALYRSAVQACNRANPGVRRMLVESLEEADFGVIRL